LYFFSPFVGNLCNVHRRLHPCMTFKCACRNLLPCTCRAQTSCTASCLAATYTLVKHRAIVLRFGSMVTANVPPFPPPTGHSATETTMKSLISSQHCLEWGFVFPSFLVVHGLSHQCAFQSVAISVPSVCYQSARKVPSTVGKLSRPYI
jgi:hypothetical protein